MDTLKAIREQLLALSPVERAGLIEDLLGSFDSSSRASLDAEWAAEAESRLQGFEEGALRSVSLEESKKRFTAE